MSAPEAVASAATGVGPRGWELRALEVAPVTGTVDEPLAGWTLEVDGTPVGVEVTRRASGRTVLEARLLTPVPYPCAPRLRDPAGTLRVSPSSVTRVTTAGADLFADRSEPGLPLRRYDPDVPGPHPLIVFLHGGAEAGDDNWAQLVGTFGAAELALRHPDHVVLAPQAPAPTEPVMPQRLPFPQRVLDPDTGWSRPVLARVADHVRGLVADGRVDPARVLVTGVSMGGAGVLRMLDVAPDLVAGAAPVCPTMTPETFGYLRGLHGPRETSLWVSSAYVDHTPDRHKYLVDGVLELVRSGARDVHLTLYSPEQLAAIGIPSREGLDTDALLAENHASWVLTYSNAEGILDWLTTRRKDAR